MAVVAVDFSADAAQTTATAARSAGGQAITDVIDLGTSEGSDAAVAAAVDGFGRIDVLVNNAGVYRPSGVPPDIDWELFERTCAVNLHGPLRRKSRRSLL
ncbi:hypothetical protein GCM10011494_38690 [Novosphingobium endophyticum]|uniref:SDR family NAD(P)-dependent oxidoreductase n=2 Tax=Novosphingobium endophyticum TaxID=1955250 RepID=A0A916TX72_9SPHN|nr:hypothetical protein GCM10011494_38690 [Novosphingobium endophyticum]